MKAASQSQRLTVKSRQLDSALRPSPEEYSYVSREFVHQLGTQIPHQATLQRRFAYT